MIQYITRTRTTLIISSVCAAPQVTVLPYFVWCGYNLFGENHFYLLLSASSKYNLARIKVRYCGYIYFYHQ